jgi:hypothetical protein
MSLDGETALAMTKWDPGRENLYRTYSLVAGGSIVNSVISKKRGIKND